MKLIKHIPSLVCGLLLSVSGVAFASDFYVFPVKELEGASQLKNKALRPLIDPKALGYITAKSQQETLAHFVDELAKTYPDRKSVV